MHSLSAFKTYDIRGIWQSEIDEQFGLIMGYSLGLHLIEKYQNPKILIASDVREANNSLIGVFLRGMKSAGIDEVTVIGASDKFPQYEYGICSTPIAYYAAQDFNCTCIFTASHNPSEYVGMKIVDSRGLSVKSEELREMYRANENTTIDDKKMPNIAPYSGIRIDELIADLRTKFHTLTKIPKITIDYSHGAATHFEQEFLKEVLGSEEMCKNKHDKEQAFESKGAYGSVSDQDEKVKGQSQAKFFHFSNHIFTNPDGRFPAHDTDTSRFANYQPLITEIQRNGSDFGFIFDGDADRFGMVTPDGTVVTGDILLSIIARQLLTDGTAEKLGSKTIFQEVFCGRIVGDTVRAHGGDLRVTRVGRESFVREVMELNGLLAGEVSTHLLFKEYGTIEMPLAGLYYILKTLENYENATALVAEFNTYARGQVLQFITDKKDETIEAIKQAYSQYQQITIDGIRIEAPDWWFCVRKSGTEPMLKVALEASTREQYDTILAELRVFFAEQGAREKV